MSPDKQIEMVRSLVGESNADEGLIIAYLNIARNKMLERLYPYDVEEAGIPERYSLIQCELATRLYLKRGAEGEISHSENSISRTYSSVDEEDILSRLTPFAKVVK